MPPQISAAAKQALLRSGSKECPYCHFIFSMRKGGLTRHMEKCKERGMGELENTEAADLERRDHIKRRKRHNNTYSLMDLATSESQTDSVGSRKVTSDNIDEDVSNIQIHPPLNPTPPLVQPPNSPPPILNSTNTSSPEVITPPLADPFLINHNEKFIVIIHHPSSNQTELEEHIPIDNYLTKTTTVIEQAGTKIPWWYPFESEADFTFAELVSEMGCSATQINQLLDSIKNKWTCGESKLSFQSAHDVKRYMDLAKRLTTQFEEVVIEESYIDWYGEKVDENFTVHVRPVMKWIMEMVTDPLISHMMRWHPVKKYLVDEAGNQIAFWDDLDCGEKWWETQSQIVMEDPEGVFLPLLVYSDSTQLTRFNHRSFHPVNVRLVGIPGSLQNTYQRGGSTLVGHLPKIDAPVEEKGRQEFINFKRRVQHRAIQAIFSSIQVASNEGIAVSCGDGSNRVLYPGIYCLSMDFEEQSDFALTKGPKSLKPCTVCLVPREDLMILTNSYEHRTAKQSSQLVTQYLRQKNANQNATKERKELETLSLRPVKSAFWHFGNSDPHAAIAYDQLHFFEGGVVKHLLDAIYSHIGNSHQNVETLNTIDDRFAKLPPWPKCQRFESITSITFSDSAQRLTVFNCLIPIIHDFFEDDNLSVILTLHLFGELRSILAIEVLTNSHIDMGKNILEELSAHLPYTSQILNKNLEFIKMHFHSHALIDSHRFGPSCHFTTTIGEKGHITLHHDFARTDKRDHSNKKLVELGDERSMFQLIRSRQCMVYILLYILSDDLSSAQASTNPETNFDNMKTMPCLGGKADGKVQIALDQGLIPANGRVCELDDFGKISLYTNACVQFRSLSNLTLIKEYIRANPSFHGHARFDTVLVLMPDQTHVFARVHKFLQFTVLNKHWDVALVTLFQTVQLPSASRTQMCLVREDTDSSFIEIRWIVRRVYICEDSGSIHDQIDPNIGKDFWVNDLIDNDPDMYLCLQASAIEPCL